MPSRRNRRTSAHRLALGLLIGGTLPLALSSQESEPKPLKKVIPVYPEVLKRLGLSGTVRLKILIAPDGSVREVEIRGGGAIFAESASKAVKQWRYALSDKARSTEVSVDFECCATIITNP